mgnify:CR=1 FL=1
MDLTHLSSSINTLLDTLDRHHAAAKKVIGAVRPDLPEASRHTQAAHAYLGDLAVLILRAENFFGIQQLPDVIARLNKIHDDLHEIEFEISACNAVLAMADKRERKQRGKRVEN